MEYSNIVKVETSQIVFSSFMFQFLKLEMFELRVFGSRVQSESRKLKLGHFEFRTEWTLKWGCKPQNKFAAGGVIRGVIRK